MKIEYAIRYLDDLKRCGKEEFGIAWDMLAAVEMGAAALREKADREKGCEFCTNFLFGIRCEVMCDWADDKKAVWETNVMHFCPMCGKKLKGADE
jgi:hypothetical protein